MIISLKPFSKHSTPQQVDIRLSERLPKHIVADCILHCDYLVKSFPDYYTISLDVSGELPLRCLRCLDEYCYPYENHTELAICRDDETAEKLMEVYECIVSDRLEVDLVEVLTDELHLYVPEKHADLIDCHDEIASIIINNE